MPEETKLKPCPNVCCIGVPKMHRNRPRNAFVVICSSCGWSAPILLKSEIEASELWNTRPESELERLARQVAQEWERRDRIDLITSSMVRALDTLAAHFAEQDKERKSEDAKA